MRDLGIILLAAGLGKRMKSSLPKVLHSLGGKPLLLYPFDTARSLNPQRISIVVGHGADRVRVACDDKSLIWVFQERQLGTGHAVRCAKEVFLDFSGDLLILSGDVPFMSQKSLLGVLRHHRDAGATLTLLTAALDHPSGYGRILRNDNAEVTGIVEERDATEKQRSIKEVNAGVYGGSPRFLFSALEELTDQNRQGEYYLPDIVGVALKNGKTVTTVQVHDPSEILGINTREELAIMEKKL
jgi:UDP-N-acetylglucosamine diphosphorylase/glucosamine-1-phosphate N-acetyltransferase